MHVIKRGPSHNHMYQPVDMCLPSPRAWWPCCQIVPSYTCNHCKLCWVLITLLSSPVITSGIQAGLIH